MERRSGCSLRAVVCVRHLKSDSSSLGTCQYEVLVDLVSIPGVVISGLRAVACCVTVVPVGVDGGDGGDEGSRDCKECNRVAGEEETAERDDSDDLHQSTGERMGVGPDLFVGERPGGADADEPVLFGMFHHCASNVVEDSDRWNQGLAHGEVVPSVPHDEECVDVTEKSDDEEDEGVVRLSKLADVLAKGINPRNSGEEPDHNDLKDGKEGERDRFGDPVVRVAAGPEVDGDLCR